MKQQPDPRSTALAPDARAKLVREAFDAISTVGFLRFCHEERSRGEPTPTEADRKEYAAIMDARYWQDFQQMTARATDAQLVETLGFWKMEAHAEGLKEWQQAQQAREATKAKARQIDLDMG